MVKKYINKDLTGDGRRKVYPNPNLKYIKCGHGDGIVLGAVRLSIDRFKKNRYYSVHSPLGITVWAIQEWGILNNIKIKVTEIKDKSKTICFISERLFE